MKFRVLYVIIALFACEIQDAIAVDLEVSSIFSESQLWMITPVTAQDFTANIHNISEPVDSYDVLFQVMDYDGEVVWENRVEAGEIGEDEEVSVSASESWLAPDDLGNYTVWAILEVEDDVDEENNVSGIDQIVFNPIIEDEQNDMWLGFTDDELENSIEGDEGSGWAVAFHHPGAEFNGPLSLDSFRILVENTTEDEIELPFAVHMLNHAEDIFELRWEGIAMLPGEIGEHWVEVDLTDWGDDYDPDGNAIYNGEAWMITYFYQESTRLPVDLTPPRADINEEMPVVMFSTDNGGDVYERSNVGDYPIQAKLSGIHKEGFVMLEIIPEELIFSAEQFGVDHLEIDYDYVIEAQFRVIGTDSITVSEIVIAPRAADFISIEPNENIVVLPEEPTIIIVTFRVEQEDIDEYGNFELMSNILIRNDTDEGAMFWGISVVGPVSVNEHIIPGIPTQFGLSQNHPNPFNPTTTVDFAIANFGEVKINMYDTSGRLVKEVYNGNLSAGYHRVTIDAADLSAGVYFYRLTSADFVSSHKMVLMK